MVKTALKLLLVFVEYSDSNCLLLMEAVNVVDTETGNDLITRLHGPSLLMSVALSWLLFPFQVSHHDFRNNFLFAPFIKLMTSTPLLPFHSFSLPCNYTTFFDHYMSLSSSSSSSFLPCLMNFLSLSSSLESWSNLTSFQLSLSPLSFPFLPSFRGP